MTKRLLLLALPVAFLATQGCDNRPPGPPTITCSAGQPEACPNPHCYRLDPNSVSTTHPGQVLFFFADDSAAEDHQGTHEVNLRECEA